jgi:hypothetical protein
MVVRYSIRGNVAAAKARCLSQVKKRYVTKRGRVVHDNQHSTRFLPSCFAL